MAQDTQANPGTLIVGQTLTATTGTPSTSQYFAVELTAGTTYDFTVAGLAPYSDEVVATTEDDFSGNFAGADASSGSGNAVENLTADTTGIYYVSINNSDNQLRTYTLTATVVSNSYTLANPTTLTIGKTTNASIESANNTNWFEINLQAGHTYNFVVSGLGNEAYLNIEPLAKASDLGHAVEAVTMSTGVINYNFTADTTGTYAVELTERSGVSNVAYTIAANNAVDSYTLANPGALTVGGSVNASIESQDDADWFAISLVAGDTYTFSESGLSPGVTLAVYAATDAGDTPLEFEGSNAASAGAVTTTFTATTTGIYDVMVRDNVANIPYTLSASLQPTTPGTFYFSPYQDTITISSPSLVPANSKFISDGNRDAIAVATGNAPTTPVDLSTATIVGVTAITDNDTTFTKGDYGVLLSTTEMGAIKYFNGSYGVVGDGNPDFYNDYTTNYSITNIGTSAFTLASDVAYFNIYPDIGTSATIWMADTDQVVSVGDFANTVYGGAGNDVDFLGAGLNKFYGGTGNDTIVLFAEDINNSPGFPAGQVFDGGSGRNEILLNTSNQNPVGYSVDFTGDTLTNIQTLAAWERTATSITSATISAAQFAEISNYSGDITVAGVTNVSLAGKSSVTARERSPILSRRPIPTRPAQSSSPPRGRRSMQARRWSIPTAPAGRCRLLPQAPAR